MMRRTLIALLACAAATVTVSAQAARDDAGVVAWLQSFDRAFMSKDLEALSAFYHPDVTIFEGGGVNNGWADYRDHHIGPLHRFGSTPSNGRTKRFPLPGCGGSTVIDAQ